MLERNMIRAIARLRSLARLSHVFSMQETLVFACDFVDEAVALSSVAVAHAGAPQPLVWRTTCFDHAPRHAGTPDITLGYAQIMQAPPGGRRDRWHHDDEAGADDRVITRLLRVPLLGIIRVESAGAMGEVEAPFLEHVVMLLSLALHRSVDCRTQLAA